MRESVFGVVSISVDLPVRGSYHQDFRFGPESFAVLDGDGFFGRWADR